MVRFGIVIIQSIKYFFLSIIFGIVVGIFLPPVGAVIAVIGIIGSIPMGFYKAKEKADTDIMHGFDEALKTSYRALNKK